MSAEERLAELGLDLPAAPEPKGLYKPVVVVGNLAYTSGHLPVEPSGDVITGRLGEGFDVQSGQRAAMTAALGILASLNAELGSLDRVRRLVKLFGLVNSTPDFDQQPAVINAASQVLAHVFGPEAGVAARTAAGAGTLPLGAAVEIEAVFEVDLE